MLLKSLTRLVKKDVCYTWSAVLYGSDKRLVYNLFIWYGYTCATTQQNVSSGVSDQARHKPACASTIITVIIQNLNNEVLPLRNESRHDKTNKMNVHPARTDQPGHPPSLIRVFTVCSMGSKGPKLSSWAQRRLIRLGRCSAWSESSLGAQPFCWFCHVAAQMHSNDADVNAISVAPDQTAPPSALFAQTCLSKYSESLL